MKALLDTHIWAWWLTGNPALMTRERTALDTAATAGELFLAAISLWEAQMLHARKRLALPLPFADWLPRASAPAVVTMLPLDVPVIVALEKLPERLHGDPANRLIVATAKTHRLPIATRDLRIRASRTVPLWKP